MLARILNCGGNFWMLDEPTNEPRSVLVARAGGDIDRLLGSCVRELPQDKRISGDDPD
ncbi:MAG TPA: hypothetical protein VGO67_22795 [Verrucomicrobiae bacterium]